VAWFKRGGYKQDKNTEGDSGDPVSWVGPDDEEAPQPFGTEGDQDDAGQRPPAAGRNTGPWDVEEVEPSEEYIDLGGLWLPGRPGMELRLEVEEANDRVIAATVQLGESAVQLQAFAAPRTSGIWDEIRTEIAASVTRQGGTADEVPGPFGRELLARVPARSPDGRPVHQPARFAGIDGPRWFLRAVFHGEAAYQADRAGDLEDLVRGVVVVRGTEAMAPRELLTLRLPLGAQPEGEEQEEEAGDDGLRPPVRGPEITEVR
jgi:hypothetical protein